MLAPGIVCTELNTVLMVVKADVHGRIRFQSVAAGYGLIRTDDARKIPRAAGFSYSAIDRVIQ